MCNSAFLQGFSLYWWPKDESKRLKVLSLVICRRWNFIMESCWKCWKQTYLEGSEDIAVSSWLFVCTSCSIKRYHKVYSYLTSWTCWELGRRNSIKRSWSLTFFLFVCRLHLRDVLDLAWSPDSMFLMSGSVDNQCMIWDVSTGTLLEYHIFRVDYLNALRLLKSHQGTTSSLFAAGDSCLEGFPGRLA